jgi:hypothetical protein
MLPFWPGGACTISPTRIIRTLNSYGWVGVGSRWGWGGVGPEKQTTSDTLQSRRNAAAANDDGWGGRKHDRRGPSAKQTLKGAAPGPGPEPAYLLGGCVCEAVLEERHELLHSQRSPRQRRNDLPVRRHPRPARRRASRRCRRSPCRGGHPLPLYAIRRRRRSAPAAGRWARFRAPLDRAAGRWRRTAGGAGGCGCSGERGLAAAARRRRVAQRGGRRRCAAEGGGRG